MADWSRMRLPREPEVPTELVEPRGIPAAPQAPRGIIDLFPDVSVVGGGGWINGAAADGSGTIMVATIWQYQCEQPYFVVGGDLEVKVDATADPTKATAGYVLRVGALLLGLDQTGTFGPVVNASWIMLAGEPGLRRTKLWRLAPFGIRVGRGATIIVEVQYKRNTVSDLNNMIYASCDLYLAAMP